MMGLDKVKMMTPDAAPYRNDRFASIDHSLDRTVAGMRSQRQRFSIVDERNNQGE